jgi:hypothetical protein
MSTQLRIAGTAHSPELAFHVNPTYALYHWLRVNSGRTGVDDARLKTAFSLARKSFSPRGVRGIVEPWETALAGGETADRSLLAFQAQVQATGEAMATAMRSAERIFMEEFWPERKAQISQALGTIEETFQPAFPGMAREHADLLGLAWPGRIDVHLVGDCGERGGAYSHPLTIDATQNTGLVLCETVLHEATHVADVHTTGRASLGDRLQAYLGERGLSPWQRFNIWHAVIFAASAASTRHHIALDHEDYATSRTLYAYFGVPNAKAIWRAYAEQGHDEGRFRQALLDDFRSGRPGQS